MRGEERFWLRGKVLVARRGKVLGVQRGKVLLVLVARREEGSGRGGQRSLYIRVCCCLSCMFLLHATTCPDRASPPLFCHDLSSPAIDQARNSLKIDL